MNYYLSKYVGKYRVKADIDQSTNDFCRDSNGNLENNMDIWIKCANGIKIFHYGGSTLQVYIPSIQRGRNIIRSIYKDFINPDNTKIEEKDIEREDGVQITRESITILDTDLFKKDIKNSRFIFDVEETDEEVLFKVMDKNLDKIIDRLKPQTSGASIRPFSNRNLPKNTNYPYTSEQEMAYNSIIENLDNKLEVGRLNNRFLEDVICKKAGRDLTFIKAEIKKKCMKVKDYIYDEGYENEYLEYLKKNLT
jgi:hypothetical protein